MQEERNQVPLLQYLQGSSVQTKQFLTRSPCLKGDQDIAPQSILKRIDTNSPFPPQDMLLIFLS